MSGEYRSSYVKGVLQKPTSGVGPARGQLETDVYLGESKGSTPITKVRTFTL